MLTNKFNILVDSAWGSSGKGAVTTRLADLHDIKNLSSCNFPNAGHTVVMGDKKFVFKAIPSGAALATVRHRRPTLWIGPNSGFTKEQLFKELLDTGYLDQGSDSKTQSAESQFLKSYNISDDVIIHNRSMIVTDEHIKSEAPGGAKSTLHISSTMSGSGAAIVDKAMRGPDVSIARSWGLGIEPMDFYNKVWSTLTNQTFLHEVSQGFALSLNSGTHYPHCTSRDCTPQQACSDFGIPPHLVGDIYLNVRSFPIRVGNNYDSEGNQIGFSGDCMTDQMELSWQQLAENAQFPASEAAALAEKERTTVTKKIRRVFTQSWMLLQYSAKFCGATKMVLNFPQYIHWSAYKVKGGRKEYLQLHDSVRAYIEKMEAVTNIPVVMICTGPDHEDYIYL